MDDIGKIIVVNTATEIFRIINSGKPTKSKLAWSGWGPDNKGNNVNTEKKIWLENMTESELDRWVVERSAILRGKALAEYDAVREELEARQKDIEKNCNHENLKLRYGDYEEHILYCGECRKEFYAVEIKLSDNGLYRITSYGKSLKEVCDE